MVGSDFFDRVDAAALFSSLDLHVLGLVIVFLYARAKGRFRASIIMTARNPLFLSSKPALL